MPPRHPTIAAALGPVRRVLRGARLPHDARVLVACSGGPDSMALLGLLHCLAPSEGVRLGVGHVDHGLRPNSAHEAAMVEAVAKRLGLPVAVRRLDLETGSGLPARARAARALALRSIADEQRAACIALGHTATDQAETMLAHLSRGASLEGLAGMASIDLPSDPDDGLLRLRPLLEFERRVTRDLAERLGLPFVDDPTNDDLRHPRVAIRHTVLPVLTRHWPGAERALGRAAAMAREAEDALQVWVGRELQARRRSGDDMPVRIDVHGLSDQPRAIRTRLVRAACRLAGVDADAIGRRVVSSIDDALLERGPSRSWDLHPHRRLRLQGDAMVIEMASPTTAPSVEP